MAVALVMGCSAGRPPPGSPRGAGALVPPPLRAREIATLLPPSVPDRQAWADTIFNALAANDLATDRQSVCAVVAVIGQESGFQADPAVPGLSKLIAARLERYQSRLGPLGEPLFSRLLAGRAPEDARTFEQRLAAVRTERDVDLLFRDLLAHYQANYPTLYATANLATRLVDVGALAELNPVTTAGSMQVSVRFSEDWARRQKNAKVTEAVVRDTLYTRNGGVYYGTARLLVYPVRYDRMLFRFADYNAGFYASRNAAVQAQLALLTGRRLTLDGDLLAYEKDGSVKEEESQSSRAVQTFAARFAPELSPAQIKKDLLAEKTLDFENSATYLAIKRAASERGRAPVPYAMVPEVAISSPKFSRIRSTAWFAESVDRRFGACLGDRPRVEPVQP